jgi:hypothetical protein
MKSRGFTCVLLGLWLGCGIALYFATLDNRSNVDRIFRDPNAGATLRMQKLGTRDSQLLLRFEADQENRLLTEVWSDIQFGLAFLFFFYLLFGTRENKFILATAIGLIVIVVIERFFVIPDLVGLGKLLDFIPESDPSSSRGRYHAMQTTFLALEIGKWVLQALLAAYFSSRTRKTSRNAGNQLNVVNKANYGHVDR